jgi:autotransporter-associated beta strand protein
VTGTGSFTKLGAGTLTISGSNGFTGATTVAGGVLALGSANALPAAGNITFTGGTLRYSAANTTDFAARIVSSTAAIGIDTAGQNVTFAGNLIAGNSGGLTKTGNGTLTLSGSNTFTGAITVLGGTLGLNADKAVPTSATAIVLDGGALLRVSTLTPTMSNSISIGSSGGEIRNAAGAQWTVSGSVAGGAGTGSLVLNSSSGEIIFGSASSTYTGGTRILAGSGIAVQADAAFGSGTISFEGGSLRTTSSGARVIGNPVAFAGDATFTTSQRDLTFNGPATILGETRTLTVSATTSLATYNGSIGDGGNALGFTKAGVGTLILGGSNTYSGTTTLSAGTLRIGNAGTTGNLTGPLVNNAAVIFDRSDNASYTNVISGSGTLTKRGAGTTLVLGPSNTYTGLTTVAAGILQNGSNSNAGMTGGSFDVAANAKLAFSRNANNVFFTSQSISGSGDVEFQGQSGGYYTFRTATYSGTLSYTGQTIVNLTTSTSAEWFQNSLFLEKDNVLPNATVLNMQSGKVYMRAQTGTGISIAGITGSAGTFITTDQSGQKLTATVASGSSFTYAGKIGADGTGTGNDNILFTKAGAGTQIFTGSNSYTGGTEISGGTLQIGAGGTAGQIVGNVTANAALVFDRSDDISFAGLFSGSTGTVTKRNATTLTLSAESMPFTGSFAVASGSLRFTGTGSTVVINALITGSGALVRDAVANAASSFLVLTGSNNYSGGTTINAGFVRLAANNAIGTGPLVFTATTNRGSLDLQGFNQTVAGLTASNTTQYRGDIYNNQGNALSTLTIDTPTGQTFTYANQIGVDANFLKVALVKAGAGTQILSGNSRYSGATAVNAGTLIVDGNNSLATGAVTVAAGAVLGGSGTIGGATTVTGTLSPGNSPGVLSIASLVLDGPSTSLFEIDGTGRGTSYDGVTITQSAGLTYGGALSLVFSNTFADDTTFDLFNFSGSPQGSFSSVTASGPYGALTFTNDGFGVWTSGSTSVAGQTMTFTQSTGDLVIVPEPGALALAGLGIAAAAWIRRRRA